MHDALKPILLFWFLTPLFCVAATWDVGSSYRIHSIKEAIFQAASGDTLYIHSGVYKEGNIIIDKPLILIGIDWPVIDGEKKGEIFTVKSHDVTLQGMKIINSGMANVDDIAAINGVSVKRLKVLNNQLEDTFFGIHLTASSFCTIAGNRLKATAKMEYQSGNGIHLWKCDNITVRNNQIRGHRDGIYFEFVTNSHIEKNVSQNNLRYGLHFMFSNDDEYLDNIFKDNGAGVAVMFSKRVKMMNNKFVENWGSASYGLLLKEISDCSILENVFESNTIGILLEGVNRGKIEKNDFRTNGWAVKLQASSIMNEFNENNFFGNTFDMSTNGTMMENEMNFNYWDKYEGYDLDKDKIGDVPFHPVSLYSMIVEKMPTAVMLWRSFLVFLLDRTEKLVPVVTPPNLRDDHPMMKAYDRS